MSGKSIVVQHFRPGWHGDLRITEFRPLPLSSVHVYVIEGSVRCFYPDIFPRVREDVFLPIVDIFPFIGANVQESLRLVPPCEILRIGSSIEVKILKGGRPPKQIDIPPTVVVVGKHSGSLGPSVTFTVIEDQLVYVSGSIALAVDGGFIDFSEKFPLCARPSVELEFLVPHGMDGAVAKCLIYPDGRVVVDTGRVGSDSSGPSSLVFLTGIFFALSEEQLTAWRSLRVVQGKLLGAASNIGALTFPETYMTQTVRALVGNKMSSAKFEDRFTQLEISPEGRVTVKCDDTHVRSFSMSGVVLLGGGLRRVGFSAPVPAERMVEAVAEGISDFIARSRAGALDVDKLKRDLLMKKCPLNVERRESAWIKKVLVKYPIIRAGEGESEWENLSLEIASGTIRAFKPTLDKLRKMLNCGERNEELAVQSVPRPVRRFVQSSIQRTAQSMVDYIRMNHGRKCRHQMDLMKKASEQEQAELRDIIQWWNQWSTSGKYLTHSSLMGNQDIFTDTGKWVIPDDEETQTQLFKHMAWIYRHGYDTFISEIQTPLFPLIEDLDMESTLAMDSTAEIDRIFIDEALSFVKERTRALHILFPTREEFTVYIYSSSGFNRSKGRWKSSFHLVWPDVIVNGELAPIIRQTTVEYFLYKSAASRYFSEMQKRLMNNYAANIWENVFDQTTSNANNGLRMPFCNKTTWIKNEFGVRVPSVENRRCYPKGAVSLKFSKKNFPDPEAETRAREKAMNMILEFEELDRKQMWDQNELVGDRTQYKQADRNTIHRTSAFMAGMKSQGGDMREFWTVDAKWLERVVDPTSLSNDQVATWIRRGSCRRLSAQLSEYNKGFVDSYLKADLVWFEGYTLDTLRESEHYKKLTPAGQQGLKNRYRKYQESLAGGTAGILRSIGRVNDVDKLRELAKELRKRMITGSTDVKEDDSLAPIVDEDDEEENGEEERPPIEDEIDNFEIWSGNTGSNVFSFYGSMEMWKNAFSACLDEIRLPHGGYWIKASSALIWISPRIDQVSDGFSGCLELPRGGRGRRQVTATLYHHCGKVVVTGDKKSTQLQTIVDVVKKIAKPDDKLYHPLHTEVPDYRDIHMSFPLIDRNGAKAQREEFEQRWKIMESIASDTSTIEPETTAIS
jgi:hypothetical protein